MFVCTNALFVFVWSSSLFSLLYCSSVIAPAGVDLPDGEVRMVADEKSVRKPAEPGSSQVAAETAAAPPHVLDDQTLVTNQASVVNGLSSAAQIQPEGKRFHSRSVMNFVVSGCGMHTSTQYAGN